ncbi:unnamed protein product [Lactuca virosa]|uniref:Transposase (putative) gypsy type domain-containing protein n=1 Tax=Lactuca virosa TaxID=75947 RepID=A0AAU9MUY2_9ASTR|nr:unnamed protein product [Lactuca virosa]
MSSQKKNASDRFILRDTTHTYQFEALQQKYGFLPEEDMTFPSKNTNFINPPEWKIGIYVKHLDVGYRLQTSNFFREVLHHHKVHFNQSVPNGVDKVVVFEMLCHAHAITLDLWVFRHFFYFTLTSSRESCTFVVRKHSCNT